MKVQLRTFAALLAALILGAFTLAAATPTAPAAADTNAPAAVADEVVAKAKAFEIKRSDVEFVVNSARADASAHGQQIPPDEIPNIELMAMNHLVEVELLSRSATAAQKASGKEEGDRRFEELKKQAPSEELLNLQLKAAGLTQEKLRDSMVMTTTADAVVRDKIVVTDDQIKKFYDDNPAQFEVPQQVRASHILFAIRDLKTGIELSEEDKKAKLKQADGVLKRARAGEDFDKLVQEFTDDTASKTNHGQYTFGHGDMVPEFEGAAFSMKTNQISDLVTTQFGYHIIKLNEIIPPHMPSLAEKSASIKSYLQRQQARLMVPQYVAELKKTAELQILDEKLKALAAAEAAGTNSTPAQGDASKPPAK